MLLFVASCQSQHLSTKKINKKISAGNGLWSVPIAHKIFSNQTNVLLNPLLIRSLPSWSNLWSYHPQTEVTSDHSIPRPKWLLIIPSPDRSDLWSYHPQTNLINVRLNPPLIRPFPSWMTSDHTIPRSKWHLIISSPDRSVPLIILLCARTKSQTL